MARSQIGKPCERNREEDKMGSWGPPGYPLERKEILPNGK